MVSVSAPGRSKLRAVPSFLAPSAITAQASPAEHEESGEDDRVRIDDPLQVHRSEAEVGLDRGQGDVDDGQVKDHHELRYAADGKKQAQARAWPGSRRRLLVLGPVPEGADAEIHFAAASACLACHALSTASDPSTIRPANMAESLTCGSGACGTGTSKKVHSGSQPSAGDHSSRRSAGTASLTS